MMSHFAHAIVPTIQFFVLKKRSHHSTLLYSHQSCHILRGKSTMTWNGFEIELGESHGMGTGLK